MRVSLSAESVRGVRGWTPLVIVLALLLATAVVAAPAGAETGPEDERIVGGTQVPDADEYPFMAGLLRSRQSNDFSAQFCGGAVIAPRWVLTAAHCVDEGLTAGAVDVLVGSHRLDGTGTRIGVADLVLHPDWDDDTNENDVALLRLDADAGVDLARLPIDNRLNGAGTDLTVIGWGALSQGGSSPVTLNEVDVPVVSDARCDDRYTIDADTMICAGDFTNGGIDSCQGDSGGPMFGEVGGRPSLVGIVSFGRGCAQARNPGVYTEVVAFVPWILAQMGHSDFDGDGRDDLAMGVPGEAIGALGDAGAANIVYGTRNRLRPAGDQIWEQNSTGVNGAAERDDRFASAIAVGDFDGDGRKDAAFGVPGEDIGTIAEAGAVNVLYGATAGLSSDGDQIWHQDSNNVEGLAENGDRLGAALAAGDFNGDGFDDLAMGAPGEDIDSVADAGAVNVLYGTANGLRSARDQIWHQDVGGVEGLAEAGDNFGAALVSHDFDGDGYKDLAIGVPNEDVGALDDAGAVNVLFGSPTGLVAAFDQIWDQNSSGIAGQSERRDHFGASLAAGYFNGNRYADLAVGVPGEDVGSIADAGAVNVLYGSVTGLRNTGDQIWDQNSSGIDGVAEAGDELGAALAAGDFDGDGVDDLAGGAPGEDVGSIADAGAVNVIYGTSNGLRSTGDQIWDQNSSGIEGAAEADDRLGSSLSTADFDGNGRDDLAIGVYSEAVGALDAAGAVNVLYGTAQGLRSIGDQIWHQDVAGIKGLAEAGDELGAAVPGSARRADVPTCRGVAATLVGSSGPDTITGSPGRDVIVGLGGGDTIDGAGGNDLICGGDGNDAAQGGGGVDRVYGDAGVDDLAGGSGSDRLFGDSGSDFIRGGTGVDWIYGGDGNDWLQGGFGDDQIWGQVGNDQLYGVAGNDILRGNVGDDLLVGGPGNDQLFGGFQVDVCTGGPGADSFDACETENP